MSKRMLATLLPFLFVLAIVVSVGAAPAAQPPLFPAQAEVIVNANLRSGPGAEFPIVGTAQTGQTLDLVGCNPDCSWYQLATGPWIAAFLVQNLRPVATATPPSTPTRTSAPTATLRPGAATPGTMTATMVGWNVESGGALQSVVADRIGAFQGVDVWALVEVRPGDAEAYEFGAEEGENANFESYLGTTGSADRLLILWNDTRFDLVDQGQLDDIGQGGRAPIWVELRDRRTGVVFLVMVNHLHRSNDEIRLRQSALLNAWAAAQPTTPMIAFGDYNYDWDLVRGDEKHDAGYDLLTAADVWRWARPAELVTTQCSGWPCRYKSVLDFVFVAGPAQQWDVTSAIVVAPGDFPDDETTPDHRPVVAQVSNRPAPPSPTPAAPPTAKGSSNLRAGPGNGYPVVGRTVDGQVLDIVGQDATGTWFQLASGAWIAAFFVQNPPANLPVVAAPPTPVPGATPAPTATAAPNRGLHIGTVFYDGVVPRVESDEYVEIVNDGPPLNLAGWSVRDDGGTTFTFPSHTLPTHGVCRVYTDEVHPESCGFSFHSSRSIWGNAGDAAYLVNPAGTVVDTFCWQAGCP